MNLELTPPLVRSISRPPARLIQDVRPYAEIVKSFVGRHLSAAEFLPRFSHLWRCEGAEGALDGAVIVPMTPVESSLYGTLDWINDLCEYYWRSLPEGCGYRVSEEQFRKEVERAASSDGFLLQS